MKICAVCSKKDDHRPACPCGHAGRLTRIHTDYATDFSRTKGICENNLCKSEQSVVRKDEHRLPLFYCGLVEFIFYTLLKSTIITNVSLFSMASNYFLSIKINGSLTIFAKKQILIIKIRQIFSNFALNLLFLQLRVVVFCMKTAYFKAILKKKNNSLRL